MNKILLEEMESQAGVIEENTPQYPEDCDDIREGWADSYNDVLGENTCVN